MICDLAEYYGVYNYKGLSVSVLTALIFGLRDESRLKCKLSGNNVPLDTFLLGYIADSLAFIAWSKTEGASHGRNRPKSIIEAWKNIKTNNEKQYVGFRSSEDFERARAKILNKE